MQPCDYKHADWKLSLGLPNNYRPFVFFKVPVTVRVIGGVPPTPVTVKTKVPFGVDELTVKVSVVDIIAGFGLKEPVVSDGKPATENITVELKPFTGLIVTVHVAVPPLRPTVTVDGLIESE